MLRLVLLWTLCMLLQVTSSWPIKRKKLVHVPYRPGANGNKTEAPRDLTSHLTAIKERGYEEKESYEVEGIINVSFPILDEHGHAIAALTVPYICRIGDKSHLGYRAPNLETNEFSAFARDRGNLARAAEIRHSSSLSRTGFADPQMADSAQLPMIFIDKFESFGNRNYDSGMAVA